MGQYNRWWKLSVMMDAAILYLYKYEDKVFVNRMFRWGCFQDIAIWLIDNL